EERPRFNSLVTQIQEEFDAADDFATEEIIQCSLRVFLYLAERKRNSHLQTQAKSIYLEEFLQFQHLLESHLLTNRQVQFYAQEMAVSTKKLNRITYAIKQQAAKTYITASLIMEMKRFLLNTALSIKEIAYKCGFDEPTNFVKYFKKHAGIKPGNFRKKHLEEKVQGIA
ncbi:MAG: helix-turn-helix domain-containing protein, partial [Bacteroidota bacterium]